MELHPSPLPRDRVMLIKAIQLTNQQYRFIEKRWQDDPTEGFLFNPKTYGITSLESQAEVERERTLLASFSQGH